MLQNQKRPDPKQVLEYGKLTANMVVSYQEWDTGSI